MLSTYPRSATKQVGEIGAIAEKCAGPRDFGMFADHGDTRFHGDSADIFHQCHRQEIADYDHGCAAVVGELLDLLGQLHGGRRTKPEAHRLDTGGPRICQRLRAPGAESGIGGVVHHAELLQAGYDLL